MIEFVSIIVAVFGILQIILFFKIWRMTNDVNRIKANLNCDRLANYPYLHVRKLLLKGDKNSAKEYVLDSLLSDVVNFSIGEYNGSLNDIKNKYRSLFEIIGEKIPDNIEKLESADDIKKVFPPVVL